MRAFRVGLIGDFDPAVAAHEAVPRALEIAGAAIGCTIEPTWLPTTELATPGVDLRRFDGVWAVPASPYRSTDGALTSIRFARTRRIPFLGTCGGFQHAVLEYARNVLGHNEA